MLIDARLPDETEASRPRDRRHVMVGWRYNLVNTSGWVAGDVCAVCIDSSKT